MKKNELKKYSIIKQCIDGYKTVAEAAQDLNLSIRQVFRLKKGVIENGEEFLIHKGRGKPSNRAFDPSIPQKIIDLKKSEKYNEMNFTEFTEYLASEENIFVSFSYVDKLLRKNGFKSPRRKRKKAEHHRRNRRNCEGDLIQIDASPHLWFKDNPTPYALHGAIDDASGKILSLVFRNYECLDGYFCMMKQLILNYGLPNSIYSDRHSIFFSPKLDKYDLEDINNGKQVNLTTFGKAMKLLGINMIPSYSPQAKGRIERLWNTLHDRLYNYFKVHNITNIEQANQILPQFIAEYNTKFAVTPKSKKKLYAKTPKNLDLDNYLCVRQFRVVDTANSISIFGNHYRIDGISIPSKTKIEILINPTFGFRAFYKNKVFPLIKCENNKPTPSPKVSKPPSTYVPDYFSYHKHGEKLKPLNTYQEDLERIYEIFSVNIKSDDFIKVMKHSIQ